LNGGVQLVLRVKTEEALLLQTQAAAAVELVERLSRTTKIIASERLIDECQAELRRGLDDLFGAIDVGDAWKLHQNLAREPLVTRSRSPSLWPFEPAGDQNPSARGGNG
jgi:hypothetical protein